MVFIILDVRQSGFAGFYWVSLCFCMFGPVFSGFCRVFNGFYQVGRLSIGFYFFHVLPGFSEFYRFFGSVSLLFLKFYLVFVDFTILDVCQLGLNGFYWVSLGF